MAQKSGSIRSVVIGATLFILQACTGAPLDQDTPVTQARLVPQSTLVSAAHALSHGQAGFVPLSDGDQALGARLRLIEGAQDTLDLQYFLMKPDLGGALIADALLRAADRGVRVRFLLDDFFTTVDDSSLALIDAHDNIAVRIYNPTARPWPKPVGMALEFSRVNRRMHNKSFTADQAFAIIGGRNIADEYFQLNTSSEFADFDLLVVGPPVAEIGQEFDRYWNDGWAVPLSSLYDPATAQELREARDELTAELKPARQVYDDAVENRYIRQIGTSAVPLYRGRAELVVDPPQKLKQPVRGGPRPLAETLLARMRDAEREVILLTPYFVPEDYGARLLSDLAQRGVRVRIVTNSLAATNHPYVHAGYRRHRADLLKAGVELYELRADSLQELGLVPAESEIGVVMHTKLAVIDDTVFVGSLNLDPRSIKQNTELGLFMASQGFARDVLVDLDQGLADYTYRIALDDDERLQWRYEQPDLITVKQQEPGATFWKQLLVGITALLPVEQQL
ncbi:phospholipase D family protein [Tropicibacter sp. R16_0]|uniref:phospholipase D-like domain-containing protein n=1 Tax=Tropicibacter sp. R16_0 TaxID=2821102 RepID=UPI001ADC5336|nr:phospholipase D family protein [Tropicibacter sp. R16_0]MBO9450188.1 phospholipase D family protein [Tropicibacter sp. R16_0]